MTKTSTLKLEPQIGVVVNEVDNSINSSAKRPPLELGFYLAFNFCLAATAFFLGFMLATHLLPQLSIVHFQHWLHLNNITALAMDFASRWILPIFWIAWFVNLMILLGRFPQTKSRLTIEIKQYITHPGRLSNIGAGSFAVGAFLGILSLI